MNVELLHLCFHMVNLLKYRQRNLVKLYIILYLRLCIIHQAIQKHFTTSFQFQIISYNLFDFQCFNQYFMKSNYFIMKFVLIKKRFIVQLFIVNLDFRISSCIMRLYTFFDRNHIYHNHRFRCYYHLHVQML